MEFAIHTTKIDDNTYCCSLCIELSGIYVLPARQKDSYHDFCMEVLGRQMDFIQGIAELDENFAIDLRFLFDPRSPDILRVYFVLCCYAEKQDQAQTSVSQAGRYVLTLLQINNDHHEFAAIRDKQLLFSLLHPFPFEHIVEIARREDCLSLDAMRKITARHLGFTALENDSVDTAPSKHPSEIYYVFPYTITFDNLVRLCDTLRAQNYPCLFSVALRPYCLTSQDEAGFESRIFRCEKYSQLGFKNASDDVERLEPFLVKQAEMLYENCTKEMAQLQDAAFLQKVQLASTSPIPYELVTIAGATLTEHTGHPKLIFSKEWRDRFTGGFDWYQAQGKEQLAVASRNLSRLRFDSWLPTCAPHGKTHWRHLHGVSQAAAAFRLPIPIAGEFPGIQTIQYRQNQPPSDLPEQGLLLGAFKAYRRHRNIYMTLNDRRRHAYVVGQTGTGKSTLFLSLILQDIHSGQGVGVLDPHGELIEDLLPRIPQSRIEDVIYLNPRDFDYPVGLNMLEQRSEFEKDFCINYLIDVFDTLYDLKTTGGPIFEMYMRNALQLLLDQPQGYQPTIMDVPRLFQDREFRRWLLDRCDNLFVNSFWRKEAEQADGDNRLENMAPYITSKLTRFVYNATMRGIVGQRSSTIDFKAAMDTGKILLVDLRKGVLGDMNSHFLGMLTVGKIFTAALNRTNDGPGMSHKDFFLYVDEFQNLATATFISILSEARKYNLSLTVTNQYVSQLNEHIINGILGNVGTLISFRVGCKDAGLLSKEFGDVVSPNDLMGLSNFQTYIRLLVDGEVNAPFSMTTLLPKREVSKEVADEICRQSRRVYGRPRKEIEKEVADTWIVAK